MGFIKTKTKTRVIVFILICLVLSFGGCLSKISDLNEITSLPSINRRVATTRGVPITTADTANKENPAREATTMLSKAQGSTTREVSVFHATTRHTVTSSNTSQVNSEYRSEDDSLHINLGSLNLNATPEDDQAIIQVVRSVYPSFNPVDYSVTKQVRDDSFWVEYKLMIGEYSTGKGYYITFADNQAIKISEWGVSLSIPPASVISKLPAVTEQVKEAAYQQGREEVSKRNKNFVVQEQNGGAYYNLKTNECYYGVRTVYSTDETGKYTGVVNTQYNIT